MNMQNLLNKLSALTTESLTMAGGSHAPAALAGLDEAEHTILHTYRVKGQDLIDILSSQDGSEMEVDDDGPDGPVGILTVDTITFPRLARMADKLAAEKKIQPIAGPATRDMTRSARTFGTKYMQTGLDEADEPLDEATMCEVCGNESCVCESDYSADDPLDETTMCEVCSEQPYACACGSDQLAQDGSAELAQLKQMMGGQMPMAAAPVSGMNVTTNVDSTTGNKTVTVTADGPGAEDLMRILGLAGIAVAPAGAMGMAEQLANAPDPVTLDAQTQLVGMSGGPNAPHGQYSSDRARDNSMAIDKNVGGLAARLQERFVNETRTGQKNRFTRV